MTSSCFLACAQIVPLSQETTYSLGHPKVARKESSVEAEHSPLPLLMPLVVGLSVVPGSGSQDHTFEVTC